MLHGDSNLGDNGRGTKTIRVIKRRSGSDSRSLHQIFSIRWYQSVDCTSEPPKQQLYSAREINAQSTGNGENFDTVQVPFACLHTKSFRIQFEFAEADRDFNHRHLMCGGAMKRWLRNLIQERINQWLQFLCEDCVTGSRKMDVVWCIKILLQLTTRMNEMVGEIEQIYFGICIEAQ
jgi:hypothetical protein